MRDYGSSNSRGAAAACTAGGTVICVGDKALDCSATAELADLPWIEYADFMRRLTLGDMPDTVCSPMMSGRFDCVDLAGALNRVRFRGRYLVIAPDLAEPAVIRRELRGLYPALAIEVLDRAPRDLFPG
jgi:hypothetical protein